MRELSIGEVARRSAVPVSALRFYDQRGLLGDVPRRHDGQRRFPPTVLRRLALIRAAKEAGFTLAEIKLLLDESAGESVRAQWAAMAGRRLPELDALIGRLTALREMVAGCLDCGCLSLTTCALVRAETP